MVEVERGRERWVSLVRPVLPSSSLTSSQRGWLGVEVQPVERALGEALSLPTGSGLRVTEVWPGSEAEKAGLSKGDILTAVEGERLAIRRNEDADTLTTLVRAKRPGSTLTLSVWRGNASAEVTVAIEPRPVAAAESPRFSWPEYEWELRKGTPEEGRDFGLKPGDAFLVVAQLEPAGWAELAGVAPGDRLVSIDGAALHTIEDAKTIRLRQREAARPVSMLVEVQRGRYRTLFVDLE